MRRKSGQLIPIEIDILESALVLRKRGAEAVHGYALAAELKRRTNRRTLIAHGTLYRALHRLERAGLFESFWEDPAMGEGEGRPRRRLYRLTGQAHVALAQAHADSGAVRSPLKGRLAT